MNSKTAPLLASPQWGEVGGGACFFYYLIFNGLIFAPDNHKKYCVKRPFKKNKWGIAPF